MPRGPDRQWNGGVRELPAGGDHLEESVYCTVCGNIFVPKHHDRDCPTCKVAEEIERRIDDHSWE